MFSYDNTFFRIMTKVADVFIVSIMWILFSLPVVTLGASTSALYYTVHKVILGERGYITKDFWREYTSRMKDSIKCSVILELIFAFLLYDIAFVRNVLEQNANSWIGFMYYTFYILILILVVLFVYIFCYRARFEMNWKGSLLNGLRFLFASGGWAFLVLAGIIISIMIVRDMPFFIFFLPVLNAILWDFIMERQYLKVMTPEEVEEVRRQKLIRQGKFEDDIEVHEDIIEEHGSDIEE